LPTVFEGEIIAVNKEYAKEIKTVNVVRKQDELNLTKKPPQIAAIFVCGGL